MLEISAGSNFQNKHSSKVAQLALLKGQIVSTKLLELLFDEEHLHEGLQVWDHLVLLEPHPSNRLKTQPCLLFYTQKYASDYSIRCQLETFPAFECMFLNGIRLTNSVQIFLTISFIFSSSNGGLECCLSKIRSKLKCCSADHIWNSTSNLHFRTKKKHLNYTA